MASQSTARTFISSMEPMTTKPLRVATERPNSVHDRVTFATDVHAKLLDTSRAYTRVTVAG